MKKSNRIALGSILILTILFVFFGMGEISYVIGGYGSVLS